MTATTELTNTTPATPAAPATRYLALAQGRIAFDDTQGAGPLVVLVPGVGDLRAQYRFIAPALAAAGYRVVTMDLRGHGESDATFERYSGEMIGRDLIALLRHLDAGPAIVIGNSIAAGSAVYAAAEAPELISRLVFSGGFTRDPATSAPMKLLIRVLMGGPWRTAVWMGIYGTLFPKSKSEDHQEHRAKMKASLVQPGHGAAFGQMIVSSHAYAEARYDGVQVPSLFVMGSADSDFPDPIREATEVSNALGGDKLIVDGVGHYPHVEAPKEFLDAVLAFLGAKTAARETA